MCLLRAGMNPKNTVRALRLTKSPPCVIGYVTCGSRTEARRVAAAILEAKAAACVNIVPGVESHYWWEAKLQKAVEFLLLVKTTRAKAAAVAQAVKAAHSYEVPEILFVPVSQGEGRYLRWLRGAVAGMVLWAGLAGQVRADATDDWIAKLGDADEEVRVEAAEKLSQAGGPKVEAQFRRLVASTNPEHRQVGVVGLLKVSDADEDMERVRKCLADESATVRWTAALTLGRSGWVEAAPWLSGLATNDAAESVREIAAEGAALLQAGVAWRRTLPAALQQAKELRKPVLAYFHVRGSEYCEKLASTVLADKEVVNASQEFVCVRIDAVRQAAVAKRHDVRGAPTILVLDADENEMTRIAGAVERAKLLARLADARRGKLTLREARRSADQDKANVPANWKVAEAYLEDGREDLAERHLRNVIASDGENRYGYTDDALFALGYLLGKRGQHAQAVFAMEKLLTHWPAYKDADKGWYCLGLSRLALGQPDKARAALERVLSEFPQSPVVSSAKQALAKIGEK